MSCTKAVLLGNKGLSAEQVPVPLVWLLTFLPLVQGHLALHPGQKDPSPGQRALGRQRRETWKIEGGLFLMFSSFHEENCTVKKQFSVDCLLLTVTEVAASISCLSSYLRLLY